MTCERHVGDPGDDYEPCGKPAVAMVLDREPPWPVCREHRHDLDGPTEDLP